MRILSVKYTKDQMQVVLEKPVNGGKNDRHTVISNEEPRPQFKDALAKLKPFLMDLCEVGKLDAKRITIKGVHFKYTGGNDICQAIIIGFFEYKNSNGGLPLPSPMKPMEVSEGEDGQFLLPEKCVKALNRVKKETEEYVKGKKLQADMFTQEEEQEEESQE